MTGPPSMVLGFASTSAALDLLDGELEPPRFLLLSQLLLPLLLARSRCLLKLLLRLRRCEGDRLDFREVEVPLSSDEPGSGRFHVVLSVRLFQ